MSSKTYRTIIVGPTRAGKSQFCNFAIKDLTNTTNKVDSCTKEPFSNIFTRKGINLEFIDTAGCIDSGKKNEIKLEKFINYLKIKKEIDFIILILKFGERLIDSTKEYLNSLTRLFTPKEFYCHLSVVFTNYPENPKSIQKKTRDIFINEINIILKQLFNLNENEVLPTVDVFFVDTDNKDENGNLRFIEKFQDTIDILIESLKLKADTYITINTENFDCTGENAKKRLEEENRKLQEIIKKMKEERIKKENERKELEKLQKLEIIK